MLSPEMQLQKIAGMLVLVLMANFSVLGLATLRQLNVVSVIRQRNLNSRVKVSPELPQVSPKKSSILSIKTSEFHMLMILNTPIPKLMTLDSLGALALISVFPKIRMDSLDT
jgi:hypothetical protein